MLEQAITQNEKVRLSSQYQLVAGADKDKVPRFLLTDSQGRLLLGGGAQLPKWETFNLEYYGSTNNIQNVIYKVAGVEVSRIQLFYRSGGVADNDVLVSGIVTIA